MNPSVILYTSIATRFGLHIKTSDIYFYAYWMEPPSQILNFSEHFSDRYAGAVYED